MLLKRLLLSAIIFTIALPSNVCDVGRPVALTVEKTINAIEGLYCKKLSTCYSYVNSHVISNHEFGTGVIGTNESMAIIEELPSLPPPVPSIYCCMPCTCNDDCVKTDTCCAGKGRASVRRLTTRLDCYWPQIRPYSARYNSANQKYLMLKGCSTMEANDPIRRKCEEPELFASLDTKIPVTDTRLNVTYINRYCAFCNGLSARDLVFWQPEVSCINESLTTTTPDEIAAEVVTTVTCNMIYTWPIELKTKVRLCNDYVSTCNESGAWLQYNPLIEEACLAYSAPYNYGYRNIFCYLCNTVRMEGFIECDPVGFQRESAVITPTVSISFSALLRFHPDGDPGAVDTSLWRSGKCRADQVYDVYKRLCRNITCYPPRRYENDACVSPFVTISGILYKFYIKFTPILPAVTTGKELVMQNIIYFFERQGQWLGLPRQSLSLRLYMKPSNLSHDVDASPDYYLADVDVKIPLDDHMRATLTDDILAQDNMTVGLRGRPDTEEDHFLLSFILADIQSANATGEVNAEQGLLYYDIIQNHYLKHMNPEPEQDPPPERPPDEYFNPELPSKDDNYREMAASLPEYFDDDAVERITGMVTHSYSPEVMTTPKICPLVELTSSDIAVELHDWGVTINDINIKLTKAEYLDISDELTPERKFLLCVNRFKDVAEALMRKHHKSNDNRAAIPNDLPQGMLSLVCTCLSVFCSLVTLTVYALFKELRTQPGINNTMLLLTLICAQLLFQFGAGQANSVSPLACKILGILVHYFWIMTLMWMNVCSLHMFRVFKTQKQKVMNKNLIGTTLVYALYCIIVSIIPVAATIAVSLTEDGSIGYGTRICYISNYDMVGYAFALPVGIIIVANFCFFLSVIIIISRVPKVEANHTKHRNFAKIYLKLSTLTGISWVFGFIFFLTGIEILEYIFIICNAGIGVFLFLAFACNHRVRKLVLSCGTKQDEINKIDKAIKIEKDMKSTPDLSETFESALAIDPI